MKRLLMIVSLAAVAFVTPAQAGIAAGNGELGFDFGGTIFDDNVSGLGAGRLAVRGGYHFTRLFELEGQVASSAHYNLHNRGTTRADVVLTSLFVNGVFNFHSKGGNVVPYVLAGVGSVNLDFPFADASDSVMGQQLAAGCRFFFGGRDQVAFRIEASRMQEKAFDVTSAHNSYVVGFTWRLGSGS